MTFDWLTDLRAMPWLMPVLVVTALLLLALAVWALLRSRKLQAERTRPPAAVVITGLAAACCTAYSADTSWRFAEHDLHMVDTMERAALFAAGEIALLATALLARQNLRASSTPGQAGSPGVPGVLVWVITGMQVIPAYSESGPVGGSVRAFFGPILAALLWHLAMGIELRHGRPGALSSGLAATLGRELRERALSWLGLATRDRTAEQITRDRAVNRAVRLAARKDLGPWGEWRLKAAVAKSGAGSLPEQRQRLLAELAARRGALALSGLDLPSPWKDSPAPAPVAAPEQTPPVHDAQRMHPVDLIRSLHALHPDVHPSALVALCAGYGVQVTEALLRLALGENTPQAPVAFPEPATQAFLPETLDVQLEVLRTVLPQEHPQTSLQKHSLVLDLAPMGTAPHPAMTAPADTAKRQVTATIPKPSKNTRNVSRSSAAKNTPSVPGGVPAKVLRTARRKFPDDPPAIRQIMREMHVGYDIAKQIHAALQPTPTNTPAATPGGTP